MEYCGDIKFIIIYKQRIEIAGNPWWETIQGILFEIFSMEYCIEIYGIMIRTSKKYLQDILIGFLRFLIGGIQGLHVIVILHAWSRDSRRV